MQRPNSHRVMVREAERYFPVRIRVARDRLGRDHLFEDMTRWLDQHIGPGRHFLVAERQPLLPDCFLFYFVALADAQAFVDRFSCGVWIAGEWRHGHKAATAEGDMSWVGRVHKA